MYELELKYKPFSIELFEDLDESCPSMLYDSQGQCITEQSETEEIKKAEDDGYITTIFKYTTSNLVNECSTIALEYDSDDTKNIRMSATDPKIIGYNPIGVGSICIATIIIIFILQRSKGARQIFGTASAIGNAKNFLIETAI